MTGATWRRTLIGLAAGLFWIVQSGAAQAQSAPAYNGIQAGIDAYHLHEGRRRSEISRQLTLVDEMKWWSGLQRLGGSFGPYPPGAIAPSLEAIYASAGSSLPLHRNRYGGLFYSDVFEPWPRVPNDIYGAQWYDPVEQPIGHRTAQTGPDRWEYHPVYRDEVEPAVVADPVHGAEAEDEMAPPPPLDAELDPSLGTGPREF